MAKQYTQIEVTFVRETEMAVLVRTLHTGADDETEVWIPKSQIDEDDSASFEVGAEGTLSVTEWFLEKEGLL